MKKLYIVQKYVVAGSIKEALKLEQKMQPDDCFLEAAWKMANMSGVSSEKKIGFATK